MRLKILNIIISVSILVFSSIYFITTQNYIYFVFIILAAIMLGICLAVAKKYWSVTKDAYREVKQYNDLNRVRIEYVLDQAEQVLEESIKLRNELQSKQSESKKHLKEVIDLHNELQNSQSKCKEYEEELKNKIQTYGNRSKRNTRKSDRNQRRITENNK